MSIWQDWKLWAFVITACSNVGIACLIWWVQTKIRFNDLHHLALDVKEIITKVDKVETKVNGNSERISNIEGKIS